MYLAWHVVCDTWLTPTSDSESRQPSLLRPFFTVTSCDASTPLDKLSPQRNIYTISSGEPIIPWINHTCLGFSPRWTSVQLFHRPAVVFNPVTTLDLMMELIFTCILSAISPGFHRLGHIPPTLHRTSIWPLHEPGTLYDIATTSYPIKCMLLLLIWVWSSFRAISFSAQSLTFHYVGLRHLTILPQITYHANIILQHTIIYGQYLA